jgi:hypothetical protein
MTVEIEASRDKTPNKRNGNGFHPVSPFVNKI